MPTAVLAMKCRLCGKPPTERDNLCLDCTRALARVRDGAPNRREPEGSAVARMRRAGRIVLTTPIAAGEVPQRRLALWATLALVTVALFFVDTDELFPDEPQPGRVAKSARRAAPAAPRPTRSVPLLSEPEAVATDEVTDGPDESGAMAEPPRPVAVTRAPSAAVRSARGSPPAGGVAVDNAAGPSAADDRQQNEPSALVARVAVPQPAPALDDRQVLASAIEKCNEEKFLAGVICEQKARLKYCDGKWGQDPECTPKPRVN